MIVVAGAVLARRVSMTRVPPTLITMTNPKAVLAWIAMVSLGMSEGAPTWVPIAIVPGTFALSILLHAGGRLLTDRS